MNVHTTSVAVDQSSSSMNVQSRAEESALNIFRNFKSLNFFIASYTYVNLRIDSSQIL